MPKEFDVCRKKGGKIRTVKLSENKYQHVCYLGKKSFRGHVRKIESKGAVASALKDRGAK